ncbi:MAG: EamA family transporter [Burkholderiaceae bacterium]|nr:EamA family transporter [Burkholderiaceae bacterium]
MTSESSDRGALLLMGLTIAFWSVSWIVMKFMTTFIGPFDLVMIRYALAFAVLFVLLLVTRRSLRFPPWKLTLGIAVFQTAAFQCLVQLALMSGGAGHVVMLAYTMPFWVVLFAWLLLNERPKFRHVVAFVLAGLGLFAVIAPWQGLGTLTSSILAIAGGACWGLGTVISKIMMQRHSPDVLNLTTWQMLLGAVLVWPFTVFIAQPAIIWEPELIWGIIYMAVLASAGGWWLWLSVVQRVSATVAGMSALGVPVVTVILAWLILSEQPTGVELVGVALIMLGLVVVNRPPKRTA